MARTVPIPGIICIKLSNLKLTLHSGFCDCLCFSEKATEAQMIRLVAPDLVNSVWLKILNLTPWPWPWIYAAFSLKLSGKLVAGNSDHMWQDLRTRWEVYWKIGRVLGPGNRLDSSHLPLMLVWHFTGDGQIGNTFGEKPESSYRVLIFCS